MKPAEESMRGSLYPVVTPDPPRPSRILTPRDQDRHHGRERHTIPGSIATLILIAAGERLAVINDEGGRPLSDQGRDRAKAWRHCPA